MDEQGDKLRIRPESFADHYSQARMFFNSQTENEQAHIASSVVFELSKVTLPHVQQKIISNYRNISENLAARIAKGLGIPVPAKSPTAAPVQDFKQSPALSIQKNMKPTLQGRCVGILIADGSNAAAIDKLKKDIKKAGGTFKVVAPKLNGIVLNDKTTIKADGQLAGTPSQLFDAVAIILSDAGTNMLLKEGAAVQFAMDAFGHLKAIAHTKEAQPLLDKAGVVKDEGVMELGNGFVAAASKRYFDREPSVRTLA